jgi:glycerophosphoryl diester phosphodiesterase
VAKGHEVENTLLGFKSNRPTCRLHRTGCAFERWWEIIVIHDETLDRTTNGKGAVNQYTIPELKRLINGQQTIPTLTVFDLIDKKCEVNIELKVLNQQQWYAYWKIRSWKKWNYSQFIVSSFDWNALKVSLANSAIPIGVLTETDLDLALAFAKFIRAQSIHPYFHLLTAANTKKIQGEFFFPGQ